MKREKGRPNTLGHSTQVTIRLPDPVVDSVDRDSMARGETRAQWVRDAIERRLRGLRGKRD